MSDSRLLLLYYWNRLRAFSFFAFFKTFSLFDSGLPFLPSESTPKINKAKEEFRSLYLFLILIFTNKSMVLSQEDIDGCRQAFLAFDKDRSGTIDVWELRQVLVRITSTNGILVSSSHVSMSC